MDSSILKVTNFSDLDTFTMKVLLVKAGLNRLLTVYLTVAQVGFVALNYKLKYIVYLGSVGCIPQPNYWKVLMNSYLDLMSTEITY